MNNEKFTRVITNDDDISKNLIKVSDPLLIEKIKKLLYEACAGILHLPFKTDAWIQFGIPYVFEKILLNLKPLILAINERLTGLLFEGLGKIVGSLGERVLFAGIQAMTINAVGAMAISIGSNIAIFLAKILGSVASVVGWILAIGMILDLIFANWDPYGYRRLFPPTIPNDMMEQGELTLRQYLKVASIDYDFNSLAKVLLSEQEILEIQIESLLDRLIYLDALVVNSEGSRIDKGDHVNISDASKQDVDAATQHGATAARVKWNSQNYAEYNDKFMDRVRLNRYGNYCATLLMLISSAFLMCRLPFLSIVFIIITIIVLALTRLELYTDVFVNLLNKYTNKTNVDSKVKGFKTF